jgi:hypothetical protein
MSTGNQHQMLAIHVDDFSLAAMQSLDGMLLTRAMWAMLHAIHSMFPAPMTTDPPGTKRPDLRKENEQRGCQLEPHQRGPRVQAGWGELDGATAKAQIGGIAG